MKYLCGIDGFKKQWIAVTKELATGTLAWKVLPNLGEIVRNIDDYCVVAIDIPIGLTESGPRKCDIEARQLLGARRSSVFPSPISAVLMATDYMEACRIREKIEKKRMSQQAWAIVYKIKEINELIANNPLLVTKIFEVHPEVSFYYLADNQPAHFKKKTNEGIEERFLKLSRHFGFDIEYILKIKAQFKAPEDDILDAIVALWSAERIYAGRNKVLPEQESFDGNKFQKIYG
jgi:predicted RNase H-like nuclease